MPVPRIVTKEFFVPVEYPYFDENEDEHTINEFPSLPRNQNQIDNLLYLFDLLEDTINETENVTQNNQINTESNIENFENENKENEETDVQNDHIENNYVQTNSDSLSNLHQTILDIDELEGLLTELYELTSGRRMNSNQNDQQELLAIDDD